MNLKYSLTIQFIKIQSPNNLGHNTIQKTTYTKLVTYNLENLSESVLN